VKTLFDDAGALPGHPFSWPDYRPASIIKKNIAFGSK